jgi:tetratricopeptide (TPR) repeat protein
MIGHIAFVLENYQKAAKTYDKVIIRSISNLPHKDRIAEEIIISYYRIENRPKAEKLYDRFEKLLKKNKKAKLNIKLNSGIYYVNFNPSKATRIFSKIIKPKDNPKQIKLKAYFWRGVAKMELKKADEAYRDFEEVEKSNNIKLKNRVMLKLGTLNFSKENYQKALDYYYYVIQNDSIGNLALNAAKNFAIVCKTIEAWEKAIDAYEIILDRWGNKELQAETVFNIAFCYYRNKKYNQAIKMFQKALPLLKDRNTKAESQYWIAESYLGLDNYEEAVNSFLKVSYNYGDLEQWAATADLKAGEAYIKLRKNNKARYILEKIISKYGLKSRWGKQANDMIKQI